MPQDYQQFPHQQAMLGGGREGVQLQRYPAQAGSQYEEFAPNEYLPGDPAYALYTPMLQSPIVQLPPSYGQSYGFGAQGHNGQPNSGMQQLRGYSDYIAVGPTVGANAFGLEQSCTPMGRPPLDPRSQLQTSRPLPMIPPPLPSRGAGMSDIRGRHSSTPAPTNSGPLSRQPTPSLLPAPVIRGLDAFAPTNASYNMSQHQDPQGRSLSDSVSMNVIFVHLLLIHRRHRTSNLLRPCFRTPMTRASICASLGLHRVSLKS